MEAEYQEIEEGTNIIEIHLPDDFMNSAGRTWKLNSDGTGEEIHVVLMTESGEGEEGIISQNLIENGAEILNIQEGSEIKEGEVQDGSHSLIFENQNLVVLANPEGEAIDLNNGEQSNLVVLTTSEGEVMEASSEEQSNLVVFSSSQDGEDQGGLMMLADSGETMGEISDQQSNLEGQANSHSEVVRDSEDQSNLVTMNSSSEAGGGETNEEQGNLMVLERPESESMDGNNEEQSNLVVSATAEGEAMDMDTGSEEQSTLVLESQQNIPDSEDIPMDKEPEKDQPDTSISPLQLPEETSQPVVLPEESQLPVEQTEGVSLSSEKPEDSSDAIKEPAEELSSFPFEKSEENAVSSKQPDEEFSSPKSVSEIASSYKKLMGTALQLTSPGRYRPALSSVPTLRGPSKPLKTGADRSFAKRPFGLLDPNVRKESLAKRFRLLDDSDSDTSSSSKYDGKAYIRVKNDTKDIYIDYIPESGSKEGNNKSNRSASKKFNTIYHRIRSGKMHSDEERRFDELLGEGSGWASLSDSDGEEESDYYDPASPLILKNVSVLLPPMPKAVVRSAVQGYLRVSPMSKGRFLLSGIGESSSDGEGCDTCDEDIEDGVPESEEDYSDNIIDDTGFFNTESYGSANESGDDSSKKDSEAKTEQDDKSWSAARAKLEALMNATPQEDDNEESGMTSLEIVECTGHALPTSATSDSLASMETKEDMPVPTIYSIQSGSDVVAGVDNATNAVISANKSKETNSTSITKEVSFASSLLSQESTEASVSSPLPASSLSTNLADDLNSKPFSSLFSDDERPEKKVGRKHAQDLPVKCPLCVKTYVATEEELNIHLRFHEEGCKTLKCPICGRVEIAWYHMARHARRHPEMHADINKLNIGDRYKKSCPECNRKYATKAGLMRHFEMYHGSHLELFQCQECHRFFKDIASLSRHMDSHRDMDYWCKECEFTTKIKKDFLIHRRSHGAEVFVCSECQHPFTKQTALKHHLAIKHKIREPVLCDECGCCYSSQTGLQIHIQRMHKQDQKHPCPYCPYVGTMRSNLYQHIDRTHVKPFRCDQCDYATKAADTLQRHMTAFHDQSRTHICPHCRYRAQTVRHLTEHLRLQHNPNVLRYPCDYCSMKFKTLTMLRDHLPSHTGQMLYTCKICNFRCKYRPNMHRHMKKKHPGEPLKENIQGPRQDVRFATRKRNEVADPGNAPEVIISSVEPGGEINPEVTIMTDDTLYTVEETMNAINTLDGIQLSTGEIATITTTPHGGLAVNGEEMIEVTEATAESLISSLLTVDPETGAVLLNGKAVTVDGNVAFQIVQEEDADASGSGDQAHKAVELLLLAMDPSVSNSQTETVEVPVINVSSEGFVTEETGEAVDALVATEGSVVVSTAEN